jgi:hypothetical protein
MSGDKSNAYAAKTASSDAIDDLRLRAARKRLVESSGQEDAIEGVREIVANFLGSEEMGLFRVDRRTATFQVFWSFGIDLERYDLLQDLGDAGLQRVMRGECHVEFGGCNSTGERGKAQAFVPISVADQTIAVLAILRLLPQKGGFDRSDMDLFKLLSNEAAKPLFGASGYANPGMEGSGARS